MINIHNQHCHVPLQLNPTFVLLSLSLSKMFTIAEINTLVAEICTHANALPLSVPNGSKDDKLWAIMNLDDGKTPHETFNKCFDAMFSEDCYNVQWAWKALQCLVVLDYLQCGALQCGNLT